jgi:signal transduction histidine kinase
MNRIQRLRNKLENTQPDSVERIDVLNDLFLEIFSYDLEAAELLAKEAAELSSKSGYPAGLCRISLNRGALILSRDDLEKAKPYFIEALKESESCSYDAGRACAMLFLGLIEWSFGQIEKGFGYTQDALQLSRKDGDEIMVAWGHNILGSFHYDLNDYENSLKYFERALGILRKLQSTEGEARALNGIGNNHLALGNPQKARKFQEKCLRALQGKEIRLVESRARHDLANICRTLGDFDNALAYYRQSLAMRRSIGHPIGEVTTLLQLAELLHEMGEFEEGRKLSEEALEKAVKMNAYPKICKAHQNLSMLFSALGQSEKALEHYKKFHEFEKEIYHEATDKKLKNLEARHQAEKASKEAEIYRLRNVELKSKNQQLQKLLSELKAAQAQLIHAEKMATIGKLAAGVAHEINSPLGVISSTNQLIEGCIEKVAQEVGASSAGQELAESKSYQKVMKLQKQNTELIATATDRIVSITRDLKNFASLDEADLQEVDIHEGLESTLALLAHELHGGISVRKEFGSVPKIFCFPGELNQVFMILLHNAVKAVAASGTIGIKTFLKKDKIKIQISDTGHGIPDDRIKKLFEFDFSRSGSRVKMATGFVTARSIMQKHKGTIDVESKIGQGSIFTISLPTDLKVHLV